MRNMAVLARRMDAVRLRFSGFRFPGTPAAAAAMSETTESIGLRWSATATTAVAVSATGSEARSPGLGSWSCPPPIASPPSIPDDDSALGRRFGLRINRDLSFTIIYGRLISQVEALLALCSLDPSLDSSSSSPKNQRIFDSIYFPCDSIMFNVALNNVKQTRDLHV